MNSEKLKLQGGEVARVGCLAPNHRGVCTPAIALFFTSKGGHRFHCLERGGKYNKKELQELLDGSCKAFSQDEKRAEQEVKAFDMHAKALNFST